MISPDEFISVVIPFYKREHYLDALLNSIHQYADFPVEIVVHDDNGNALVSSKYKDKISTIVDNFGVNVGLHRSYNRAISVASSNYILALNEDMLLTKPIFKDIVSVLKKPYIGVLSVYYENNDPPEYVQTDVGARFTIKSSVGNGCAMAFRKDFWREVGGFLEDTPSYYCDTPLLFKCWKHGYFRGFLLNTNLRNPSDEDKRRDTSFVFGSSDCGYTKIFGINDLEGHSRERFQYCDRVFHQNEHVPETLYNHHHWQDYSEKIVPREGSFSTINWDAASQYGQIRWKEVIANEPVVRQIDTRQIANDTCDKYYVVQDRNELAWLLEKVYEIKPEVILELGVEAGGTLKCWEQLVPPAGTVIGIDTKDNVQWPYRNSDRHVYLLEGHTLDDGILARLKEILNGRKIDFMFIDASDGHNPDVCEKEYFRFESLLREHAIVGFHDTQDVKGFLDKIAQDRLHINRQTIGTGIYYT